MPRSRVSSRCSQVAALFVAAGCLACVAAPALRAQQPTIHALRDAEDARAETAEQLATLRAGLSASQAAVRRVAVRAVGRLERAALIPDIVTALSDNDADVRVSAARALQPAAAHEGAVAARDAIIARLASEKSPAATAALLESLGWIPDTDSASISRSARLIVAHSTRGNGADQAAPVMFGAAHGLYGLARQAAAQPGLPADVVARLSQLVTYHRDRVTLRPEVEVRVLAAMAIAAARHVTEPLLMTVLSDPEPSVREKALRAVGNGFLADSASADRIGRLAMVDTSWSVRVLGLAAHSRRFAARKNCAPYVAATADRVLSVRIQAVDALQVGCEIGSTAVPLLDALAASLPAPRGDDGGAWHLAAHALVSLAALAPERARPRIAAFAFSPDFFVRDYAALAAAKARDTATLRRLVIDPHPNVRTSAVAGLSQLVGHVADDAYVGALQSDDSQLLLTAGTALTGSRDPRAVPALLAALDRVTALRMETSRDGRTALLDRLKELGAAPSAERLRPYLADFDTLVATRAAELIGQWTGTRPRTAPVRLHRVAVPTERELAVLATQRIVITMADGGTIVMRLFPEEAPTNAARFARLSGEGKLDRLTIHRVVPARLVQGGSRGANEYAGWGAYTRDEIAVPNRRGAVGTSTRGRDTGDGQLYIDVSDGFDIDHDYTIFGEVVAGMDVVDRMQEGARIRRVRITR